jgi:hypothetical protein
VITQRGGRRNEQAAVNGKKVGKPLYGREPKQPITISLDRDLIEALNKAAAASGRSVSAIAAEWMRQGRS